MFKFPIVIYFLPQMVTANLTTNLGPVVLCINMRMCIYDVNKLLNHVYLLLPGIYQE